MLRRFGLPMQGPARLAAALFVPPRPPCDHSGWPHRSVAALVLKAGQHCGTAAGLARMPCRSHGSTELLLSSTAPSAPALQRTRGLFAPRWEGRQRNCPLACSAGVPPAVAMPLCEAAARTRCEGPEADWSQMSQQGCTIRVMPCASAKLRLHALREQTTPSRTRCRSLASQHNEQQVRTSRWMACKAVRSNMLR